MRKEFQKTIKTWKGAKPKFDIKIGLTGKEASVTVSPSGDEKGVQKWIWLDEGTEPHIIRAKNVPNLIFRSGSGFKPKTAVKVFSSSAGANTGSFIRKKSVKHPGIEAREWSTEIIKKREKKASKALSEASEI